LTACLTDEEAVCLEGMADFSGAGTNLKVGGGHRSGAKRGIFFGRAPLLFGSKSTISLFGERFRDGQYSLVSFLFAVLLLTVLPIRAQPSVKVGVTCHPFAMESAPLADSHAAHVIVVGNSAVPSSNRYRCIHFHTYCVHRLSPLTSSRSLSPVYLLILSEDTFSHDNT